MTVLIVLSSHDQLGTTGKSTGTWLEELLVPYYRLSESGFDVGFATPKGGEAPIDPWSVELYGGDPLYARYEADAVLGAKLAQTKQLADIDAEKFEAVLYPGGHGPLFDLRTNADSMRLIKAMLAAEKPVGVICHAGCVLVDVQTDGGEPLVRGRSITAFTDSEEAAVSLSHAVPYSVEQELRATGARYSAAPDWAVNVVVDGKLITGQNPASAGGVADAMIKELGA